MLLIDPNGVRGIPAHYSHPMIVKNYNLRERVDLLPVQRARLSVVKLETSAVETLSF